MWKILQVATMICVVWLMLKPDHYPAIKHEFYEVWNTIGTEEGDSSE